MPGVSPKFGGGNHNVITYEALTNIVGGNLLIPQTGATSTGLQGAQPAGDAAANCIGVAAKDALTLANQTAATTGTTGQGFPLLDVSAPEITTAAYTDVVIPVVYAAGAVAYGAAICCAAAGKVRAWVSGTDAVASRIGWCAQPGGTAGGIVGLARIAV